jgi:hypothetical protein
MEMDSFGLFLDARGANCLLFHPFLTLLSTRLKHLRFHPAHVQYRCKGAALIHNPPPSSSPLPPLRVLYTRIICQWTWFFLPLPFPFFLPAFHPQKRLWFQLAKLAEQGVLRGLPSLFKKDRWCWFFWNTIPLEIYAQLQKFSVLIFSCKK